MRLTKEERKARAKQRLAEEKAQRAQFPGCHFETEHQKGTIQLIAVSGQERYFKVRTNNLKIFQPSPVGGEAGWVEANFYIDNAESLAKLTLALAARLRALVEKLNEKIDAINSVRATEVEQ